MSVDQANSERATLTVPEVALALGVSRGHAYALAKERAFPVVSLGRRLVVPRDAFYRWLNEGHGDEMQSGAQE